MKRIYQNAQQNHEDQKKSAASKVSHSFDIANLQRAIEDPTSENLTPDTMMALQQTHGNQFVAQLSSGTRYPVQAKLTVTEANDSYEKEADATAKQVVAGFNTDSLQREGEEEEMLQPKRDTLQRMEEEEEMLQPKRDALQRMEEEEEMLQPKRDALQRQEEEEEMLQPKRDDLQRQEEEEEIMPKSDGDVMGGLDVSNDIESEIERERGGGQSLSDDTRSNMESGFGADFSNIRVHTDSTADSLSSSIQAKAFTTGSDIFFKQGAYDPSSNSGQELLAHELTHTIQQGASPSKDDTDGA